MIYEIHWDKKAKEQLKKLDLFLARRIAKKVKELNENPFYQNVKRLKNSPYFRLRVGDYRVLFEMIGNIINIVRIGHRKNIY